MKSRHGKGFTLAELLIVVAIIAVLVAISIPIFTSRLEKSREATDLANVRSAYAEVMTAAQSERTASALYDAASKQYSAVVVLKQTIDGWTTHKDDYQTALVVGGCAYSDNAAISRMVNLPRAGGTCSVTYDTVTSLVTIDWGGEAVLSHTIDPSNVYSVGSGIYEYVLGKLTAYKNNETVDTKYGDLFKSTGDKVCNDMFILPDGTEVAVMTISRSYDSFEDIKNRITVTDKATLLYNRTGQLSTIVYWNGTDWMCWQANKHDGSEPDYESWQDEANWQKNRYTTCKKDGDGNEIIQEWELRNGTAVCVSTTKR